MENIYTFAKFLFDLIIVYYIAVKYLCIQLFSTLCRKSQRNFYDEVNNEGQVAIITGGTSGIGAEVVKKLLKMKMKVIVGSNENVESIDTSLGPVQYRYLDLSSLQSVSIFADQLKSEDLNVRILIHCAGVMFCPERRTTDGFDYQFGVNYVGAALLTLLLLPCLERNQESCNSSQIVFLSSCEHFACTKYRLHGIPNLKKISSKHFSTFGMYSWSKLAIILFAYALNQKMASKGSKIKIVCLHPGIVDTNLYQHVWFAKLFPFLLRTLFLTKEQGALNVLKAAYSENAKKRQCFYWSDGRVTTSSSLSYSPMMQTTLWKETIIALSPWLPENIMTEFYFD